MTARVLHLIPTLGQGGAERQLSLLGPGLALAGQAIAVAFHTGGPNLSALESAGVPLYQLPSRSNHDPRLLTDIASVVRRFRADIVQTWLLQMDVLGGTVAHWQGLSHVLSERSSAAMYAPGGWKLRARATLGRRADAIVANSEGGLAYWRGLGARGAMHVVRNALTPSSADAPADDFGLSAKPLLIAAGRLSHEKNVPALVESLTIALRQLPDHHAIIFGDGPERMGTEALIAATGLSDRLHLGGYTNALPWWLARADAFLSASFMEGHPNVVIEAAAAGCPLVLSDIPAHREFAVGNSALFAPTRDAAALARALIGTVVNRDASRSRVGEARSLTAALSVESAARRHIDLYRTLSKTGHRP